MRFFFLFLGFFALKPFCDFQTDGFALVNIKSNLDFCPEWEVKEQSRDSIKNLEKQPFIYFGHGAQAYAFVSLDGKLVLKFFRHDHMRPFFPFMKQTAKKRRAKLKKTFRSYRIAYDELQEETGLIFLHLNKTADLDIQVEIYDKIGIRHLISLDQMEFVVQKRAEELYPTLEKWIAEGHIDCAKQGLSNLVTLLKTRCLKQIYDKNPTLKTNFGFIGNQAIQFDIGRFSKDATRSDPHVYGNDLIRITDRLCHWLDEKSPELSKHLRNEIQ